MLRVLGSFSLATLACAVLLTGCGDGSVSDTQALPMVPKVQGMSGTVHGGQQPISGAAVTLWAVGTTGYGSAATSLATTTTGLTGGFTLGTYTCPASDPDVYLTAASGYPLSSGAQNTGILLGATLTDCNTVKTNAASIFINIDEVTTVATAYALAQFMNPVTGSIGSYGYANTGLVNAFATAGNLANIGTGTAYSITPNSYGVVPQSELNTLANILAYCVNSAASSGPPAVSSQCNTLFGLLQSTSGNPPTNTMLAAMSMALHPGYNASPATSLFGLAATNPPFQPALTGVPNDWTVALSFYANAPKPKAIAIDSDGNVWTANYNNGGTSSSISELSPTGVPQNFTSYISGAMALAIDPYNNVWVANSGTNSLVGYNSGTTFAGPISGYFSTPKAMAFDPSGNLWIANYGNSSILEFSTNYQSFINMYTSGVSTPFAIAMDYSGNAWVGNGSTVAELSSIGIPSSVSPISGNGVSSPGGIAIDGSNHVWISNYPTGTVAELNNSGTALSGSGGDTGGGVGPAQGIAIDGGGNVWIADETLNRLTELNSSGAGVSPSTGYQGGSLNAPASLAIDGSGNVWVGNLNTTSSTISEFVGAAVPVITPLSSAIQMSQLATPPGTPIPVVVRSGALPYYTPGSSYSAQLVATGGNSGTYTWTIVSGALPSPMTLSTSGLISGTTSLTGTSTVTVQAADTANPANVGTGTLTLSASNTIPARGNESALGGPYAMQVEGFKNGSASGSVYGADFVASLTFNGSGLVSGEIDSNSANNTSVSSGAVSGYYAYGSDNRGTMYLLPSASGAKPIELAFAGNNFNGATPQTLRFTLFDDTLPGTGGNGLSTGAGIAKLQTAAAFSSTTLSQSFVFGVQGETPCNTCNGTISPFGPLSAVGKFTANGSGSVTFGEEDVAGVNNTYNLLSLGGSYTSPDSSGRGTLTLTPSVNLTLYPSGTLYPAPPSHYIYYIVNSGEMYIMSSDGHATTSLLSGDVLAQTGSFSDSTLSGSYVFYGTQGSNGDGVSAYPNAAGAVLAYATVQSGNQVSLFLDQNDGQGGVSVEQSQGTTSYFVDSNGRMTLTVGAGDSNQPVFYMANATQLFATMTPNSSSQGDPGLIVGQQQTPGTFGCPTAGTFAIGTIQAPLPVNVDSGFINEGTGAITLDSSSPYGVLTLGETATVSCATDSFTATIGRLVYTTFGSASAAYAIVPGSKYVLMSIDPTNTLPTIITVEK